MVITRLLYLSSINENVLHSFTEGAVYGPKSHDCGCDCEGYAGQGAKTSKGWHSVKTPWLHTGVPYG